MRKTTETFLNFLNQRQGLPATGFEIQKITGIHTRELRFCVNELLNEGVFVCADNDGYYITEKIALMQRSLLRNQSRLRELAAHVAKQEACLALELELKNVD